ncbi:MAG: metallophosphoesterase [Chitinophagaceae bacterium]|nr:metallophosphoesterase [Chitinophagaceae bacterium]
MTLRIQHTCFLLLLTCLSFAQTVIRGPYLTQASPNSLIICWNTDVPCNAQVLYGTAPGALFNSNTSLNIGLSHKIELSNLQPETRYYYSIGTGTQTLKSGSAFYFVTPPPPTPQCEKPIRFWAMGDMGKQTQQQIDVRNAYLKFIDTVYTDGWILLGDNAYENGTDPEYQMGFFNYYQDSVLPNTVLWPAVGNHDYANDYVKRQTHQIPYLGIFHLPQLGECGGLASNTERYYSFNYGNVHFVNLDSYGLEEVNGNWYGLADTLLSPQVAWLRNDLTLNHMPWVIVSYHHPPYCMGTHHSDNESDLVALREYLNPILERFNVDLVLNGHDHTYQRSQFMQKHYGTETTFDSLQHIRQWSSGFCDTTPNSCAYVKQTHLPSSKDSGTIYLVIGSGSAIPQSPMTEWPHNAAIYGNYADNGSLYFTITGNKLEAVWISTDTNQVVKDKFTLYKNVGVTKTLTATFPSTISLKASWDAGQYLWNTGDSVREINVPVMQDTIFTVTDALSCITDTFKIVEGWPASLEMHVNTGKLTPYPNPAQQTISMQMPENGTYEFKFLNADGQALEHRIVKVDQHLFQMTLEKKYPSGLYLIQIMNDKNQLFQAKIALSD